MGRGEASVTVEQIAAAMAALGLYDGENTPAEHAAEAARLGRPDAYRVRMATALLGVAQADAVRIAPDVHVAAWEEQLKASGAGLEGPVRRVEFLRADLPQARSAGIGPREKARRTGHTRSTITKALNNLAPAPDTGVPGPAAPQE